MYDKFINFLIKNKKILIVIFFVMSFITACRYDYDLTNNTFHNDYGLYLVTLGIGGLALWGAIEEQERKH